MESYPATKKLLKQKHFDKQNENLKQLGSKALDLLLTKITKTKLQKPKIYQSYHNKIAQFMIQQVGFSQPNHLLMCIGQVIRNDSYSHLPQIQCQLQMMLQYSDLPSMCSKINQMSLSQTKTDKSMQSKILNNTQDGSFKDKSQQQQSNASFNFDFLEQLERQGKVQLSKSKKSSSSKSSIQNSSFISGQKIKFTKEVNIDNLSPEVYLQMYVKSFAAELNILVQKFKKWEMISPQQWDQSKDGDYIQQFYIVIPSILNGSCKGSTKICGKGKSPNKKDARNEAALSILRQLYTNYPNIFTKMLQIRQKQAIET